MQSILTQVPMALAYYVALIGVARLAGKRLAGQATTFDLIVLISLGVVLQNLALLDGKANAVIFVLTVFAAHRFTAALAARYPKFRKIVRGGPRVLVQHGRTVPGALEAEDMSPSDLNAGLRKLGYSSPAEVRVAVLEETGHISAIARD